MKYFVCLAVFLCCFPLSEACAWQGYVVQVLDGDSLRVKRGSEIIEIRLYGVDCPEWGQEYGNKAKRYTKKKIYRKKVNVEPKDIDRYGRVVALVGSAGNLINKDLVRDGRAWVYTRYCREQPFCMELEQLQVKAQKEKKGLWGTDNPVSPWQWKWKNKKKGY
jgi:endonuclease YncB( thermonuclease family)